MDQKWGGCGEYAQAGKAHQAEGHKPGNQILGQKPGGQCSWACITGSGRISAALMCMIITEPCIYRKAGNIAI